MQVVSIPLCSFCVFVWNSLVPVKAVIIFWMPLKFSVLSEHLLWFFCLFILVYICFITSLDNMVFFLCLLRLQILFKTIRLFDLRVYFIFHATYCLGWKCGRLEYLYNSSCCNIFSSFHMKKFIPFVWLKTNCNEKGESLEELAKIYFPKYFCFYSCTVVL